MVITPAIKEAPTETTDEQGGPPSIAPSPLSSKSPEGQPGTKPSQAPPQGTLTLLGCSLMGPRVGPHAADRLPLQSTSTGAGITVIPLPTVFEVALGRPTPDLRAA